VGLQRRVFVERRSTLGFVDTAVQRREYVAGWLPPPVRHRVPSSFNWALPPVVKIGPFTNGIVAAARLRFSTVDALFSVVAQSTLTTVQRSTDLALRYRNWRNFQSPRMVRTVVLVCTRPTNYALTGNYCISDFCARNLKTDYQFLPKTAVCIWHYCFIFWWPWSEHNPQVVNTDKIVVNFLQPLPRQPELAS